MSLVASEVSKVHVGSKPATRQEFARSAVDLSTSGLRVVVTIVEGEASAEIRVVKGAGFGGRELAWAQWNWNANLAISMSEAEEMLAIAALSL